MMIPKTVIDTNKYKFGAIPLEKAMTEGISPEKPRAFIVLGLEGSGTYMMRDALVEAGCIWLDFPTASMDVPNFDKDVVIRFSFPHAGNWPDWCGYDYKCRHAGYQTFIIWMIREPNAQMNSVLRRDPDRLIADLLIYQLQFCKEIGEMWDYGTFETPLWTMVTYSAFVTSEGFRRWLFEERLQLPYPEDFEVRNENEKYYQ